MSWPKFRQAPAAALHDAVWAAALRLVAFSYQDLASAVSIPVDRATGFVQHWVRIGAVEFVGIGAKRRKMWRATRDVAPPLPQPAESARRDATAEGNLWRSMRGLKSFTPVDLAAHSSTPDIPVSLAAAQDYCQMLVRAAYLRVERKAIPGRRDAIYRLVRNTGPRAPVERRVRAVYDENLDEIVHFAGATA